MDAVAAIAEVKGWNACRAAMLAAARRGEVMSTMTFVVEFEDGKSRRYAHMEVFGGKVIAVAFRDALEEPEEDED